MRSLISAVVAVSLSCLATAADYTFKALPESGRADVTVRIEGSPSTEFRMPAWAPGDYAIFNYGKYLDQVVFHRKGQVVPAVHGSDPNLWTIEGGADEVSYEALPSRGIFSPNLRVKPAETFISGPGVFGWFGGHQNEKQKLTINLVPSGAKVYCALKFLESPSGESVWQAPDYDVLLDSPIVIGTSVKTQEFKVDGKRHRVIAFGRNENVDMDSFANLLRKAAQEGLNLFGEFGYSEYALFLDFGGGGGGLEHLNGARVGMAPNGTADSATTYIFHEYFHNYNVKRIRAKVLGPFDYTQPAITGSLWWLEGVTDYYAWVQAYRAGLVNRKAFLDNLAGDAKDLAKNPATMKVSADEASRRVWENHSSYGFGGLSYYEKGLVVGACLDVAIRGETKGKKSLDDVIRELWNECKNSKPGFSETRIRELCVKVGGEALGPIYDKCVMQAGQIPLNDVLPMVGLRLGDGGFETVSGAGTAATAIGAVWPSRIQY